MTILCVRNMGLKKINNQIDLTTGTSGSIFRIGWSTPTGPGGLLEKNIHSPHGNSKLHNIQQIIKLKSQE
jgi:hypothetical protein